MHSLWFVQWDFTRRDHPGNPGGVSGSGLVKRPPTAQRHDDIWVAVDRLTKSAHFLPIREKFSPQKLAETLYESYSEFAWGATVDHL